MKLASLLGLCSAAALLLSLPAVALDQPGKADTTGPAEVNVVLRISRKLVEELTTKKVQRTTPVHLCLAEGPLDGTAFTQATASVVFDMPPEVPAFTVLLRGTTTSQSVLTRPPVEVFGSTYMD